MRAVPENASNAQGLSLRQLIFGAKVGLSSTLPSNLQNWLNIKSITVKDAETLSPFVIFDSLGLAEFSGSVASDIGISPIVSQANNNLTNVCNFLTKTLISLDISHTKTETFHIQSSGLKRLVNLRHLSLEKTKITSLWCEELDESILPPNLITLNLRKCKNLRELKLLPHTLEELILSECASITAASLSEYPLPPKLRLIDLFTCNGVYGNLSFLPQSVENLNIALCRTIYDVNNLPKKLKKINFSWCRGIHDISKLPYGIEYADLSWCEGISAIDELPISLTYLSLSGCEKIENVTPLNRLKQLRHLSLCWFEDLPSLGSAFDNLSKLEYLDLSHSKSLNDITGIPKSVKTLKLCWCESLELISDLDLPLDIQDLDLRGCSKVSALYLEKCTKLSHLDIALCAELDEIVHLPKSGSLTNLDMSYCKKIRSIEKLPRSLKSLDISGCISVSNIFSLLEFPDLQTLDISFCKSLVLSKDELRTFEKFVKTFTIYKSAPENIEPPQKMDIKISKKIILVPSS